MFKGFYFISLSIRRLKFKDFAVHMYNWEENNLITKFLKINYFSSDLLCSLTVLLRIFFYRRACGIVIFPQIDTCGTLYDTKFSIVKLL